jgi:HSP20 family protein
MANLMRPTDQPMVSLREAMDRLFQQSFLPFERGLLGDGGYQHVPTNLWEDEDNYHLHLLVPGTDPSSVEITATNGVLTIAGQMNAPAPEGGKAIWQEWGPVQFRRQVQLPAGFSADGCRATYENGVLSLTVPKPEQVKPKNIKVQVNR